MTTIRYLKLQIWVKEQFRRARGDLTLREAGKALGCNASQILRWEHPDGGVPEGKRLDRVIRWLEKRLGTEAPR